LAEYLKGTSWNILLFILFVYIVSVSWHSRLRWIAWLDKPFLACWASSIETSPQKHWKLDIQMRIWRAEQWLSILRVFVFTVSWVSS
jgi:hypothetical protein